MFYFAIVDLISGSLIAILNQQIDNVSKEKKYDVYSNGQLEGKKPSKYVEDIFDKQGNIAINPMLGDVELIKKVQKVQYFTDSVIQNLYQLMQ